MCPDQGPETMRPGPSLCPEKGRIGDGEMPKESFYSPSIPEDEDVEFASASAFSLAWGVPGNTEIPAGVYLASMPLDRSAINRLIRALRRARDAVYGADA